MGKIGKKPVAVALSGGGRTLENLIQASRSDASRFYVAAVVSSNPKSRGIEIAQAEKIPVLNFPFPTIPVNDAKLFAPLFNFLDPIAPSLILLAGFLKPFPIRSEWRNMIINIHPALLPKYGGKGMYGMHVHRKVFANQDIESGATVHLVTEEYDEGNILGQVCVSTRGLKSPEEIAARVFSAECDLYPKVVNALLEETLGAQTKTPLRYSFS